jgi:hypothetical protein
VDEMGAPSTFDIMHTIQGAYCYTLENEMQATLSKIVEALEEHGV